MYSSIFNLIHKTKNKKFVNESQVVACRHAVLHTFLLAAVDSCATTAATPFRCAPTRESTPVFCVSCGVALTAFDSFRQQQNHATFWDRSIFVARSHPQKPRVEFTADGILSQKRLSSLFDWFLYNQDFLLKFLIFLRTFSVMRSIFDSLSGHSPGKCLPQRDLRAHGFSYVCFCWFLLFPQPERSARVV